MICPLFNIYFNPDEEGVIYGPQPRPKHPWIFQGTPAEFFDRAAASIPTTFEETAAFLGFATTEGEARP